MQTLPVNETGSSGVGRQQPDHKGYLQLVVQRKPKHIFLLTEQHLQKGLDIVQYVCGLTMPEKDQ